MNFEISDIQQDVLKTIKAPDIAISAFSTTWSLASFVSRVLVKHGLLKSTKLDCRVISVGNLQVGGAGKTPLVALIAREAIANGLKVCVLCRGYRGVWESSGGVVYPQSILNPEICGDEAALLHELVPSAYIGVGANRVAQYKKILRKTNIDLVILDDGFQHWRIKKDVEIVALTSTPRNKILYRDWASSLKNANLLIWTKGAKPPILEPKMAPKIPPQIPMIKASFKLSEALNNNPIWLITGVGDPGSVYKLASDAGYNISRHIAFADHADYSIKEVKNILKSASELNCKVALTGKDWVKWRQLKVSKDDVIVLEPEVSFENISEKKILDKILWGK